MKVYLDHVWVKFTGEGYKWKFRVTGRKALFLTESEIVKTS